jgi:NAD(P)-dependent dehydrogenase (short-subunit alcohol dehydrogenase family)
VQISLEGKTALVTGGVNGLGRMIAEGLLRAGGEVIVTGRKGVDEARHQLSSLGTCHAIETDLRAEGAIDRLQQEVAKMSDSLHILVNNAGATWGAPLDEFPDRAWAGVMDLNIRVPFATVQRLLPQLAAAGRSADPARVINIGSIAGVSTTGLNAYSYSSSKAALHHLSRELAAELGNRHIAVNTIIPGFFPTKMTAHIRGDEAKTEEFEGRIPLGRFGTAGDISGLCVFLASEHASYISGAQILLDGGLIATR